MSSDELREAKNTDYLMNRSPVHWKGLSEPCPGWEKFVEEIFSENDSPSEMIAFMQELFGYSLSGYMTEEKIFCHWGNGCNGKSKCLQALRHIAGTYCTIVEPDEIVVRKNSWAKNFERTGAKVEGKRIAIIDDLEVDTVWNEGFVKTLTAKNLRARAEYEHSREVPNRCKFHLGLNVAPEPEAENLGILRRLCIIPYQRTFEPNGAKEHELSVMIESEESGIMAWAVRGFKRYIERGHLLYPQETVAAAASYRKEHFKVEGYIQDLFEKPSEGSPGQWCTLQELKEDLTEYLQTKGLYTSGASPEKLGSVLKQQLGIESKKVWDPEKKNMTRSYLIVKRAKKSDAKSIL